MPRSDDYQKPERFVIATRQTRFLNLFSPFQFEPGGKARFACAFVFSPDSLIDARLSALCKPSEYLKVGEVMLNATTQFQPTIYGVPESWLKAMRDNKVSLDRTLSKLMPPARAVVELIDRPKTRTREAASYVHLVSIELGLASFPRPTFEDFAEGRF